MDDSVKKLLTWSRKDNLESAVVDIKNPADRKYFWNYWHTNKEYLKANGYRISKETDGLFYIFHEITHLEEEEKRRLEKESTLSLSRASNFDIDIPSPEGLNYFDYQKAGIHFMNTRNSTLLADQAGLGKSIEISGLINAAKPRIKNVLIICPASIKLNWKRELEKWLIREYKIGIVDRADYPTKVDIVIINFDVVHRHHAKLTRKTWDLLVIDEVHFLKSKTARRSKYVFGSKKEKISPISAHKKVFLSGTPIVNKPIELFPIINALDPETWSNQWKYAQRYCDPIHTGWGWDFSGASNLEELQDKLRSTIMIRRLKSEVLPELPLKFRQVVELPTDAKTLSIIQKELKEWNSNEELIANLKTSLVLAKINEDDNAYRDAVKNLREGMSAQFSSMSKLREIVALAKLPYVLEHVKNAENKIVIFAHHKSVVAELKKNLGEEAVVLVGDTPMLDRQKAVDDFQNDPKIKYFIGSIKSAGVGITLTAASHVVFAELDWVPGNVSQCEDRCSRISQKNNVLVQHLVLEGSLDAKIAKTLIQKQEVIDKALDVEYDLGEPMVPEEIIIPPRQELEKEGEHISDSEKIELLKSLKKIAAMDEDMAAELNGIGFNKFDSAIGHSLSSKLFLTNKQAVVARRLVKKYGRQLDE
jgi:SWI/SNF-related matrix-associated actin-dependent regulator of chromatin subfamily A-like protein 1